MFSAIYISFKHINKVKHDLPSCHTLLKYILCGSWHHHIYTPDSIVQNKPIRVKLKSSLDVKVSLTLINNANKHGMTKIS